MDYNGLIEQLRNAFPAGGYELERSVCESAADAIEALLAERDATIEASRGNCNLCAHADKGATVEPCVSCAYGLGMYDCWQWRGPQKEPAP